MDKDKTTTTQEPGVPPFSDDITTGQFIIWETELFEKYSLEELEANPDLLTMIPEERRAEYLAEQRLFREKLSELRAEMAKVKASVKAYREAFPDDDIEWRRVQAAALKKYGISEEEFNNIIMEAPEANSMTFGDFFSQSATTDGELLIGGLLDSILQRAREENVPVKEIVQDIQDALIHGNRPKIKIKKPDSVEFPIDKINTTVWNLLQEDTGGQLKFAAEKKGSKTKLDIIYSINFDELQASGIKITKRLLPFDKRVYVALSAIFNAGNDYATATQIHYAMGNATKPKSDQLKKIRSSVLKMRSASITVDNSEEARVYKRYGEFIYNGYLMPIEFVDYYKVQGKLTDTVFHILREPPLITFSKQRGQITTVAVELLQSPLNKTDEHLSIDDYLIERIARMKHNKEHGQAKILYKTICEKANITTAKQRQRLPGTVQRYLDHYKECKYITRYTHTADSVTIFF